MLEICFFIGMYVIAYCVFDAVKSILFGLFLFIMLIVALVGEFVAWLYLLACAEERMQENIKEFTFNDSVDMLLEYLGDQKSLKLKLKIDFSDFPDPEAFGAVALNHNKEYYVRKKGIKSLYIFARDKETGEESEICTTEDYKFFFSYFYFALDEEEEEVD